MKFLPTRKVKLSKLHMPGDFGKRQKSAHVKELAASIKAHGLAHLPVVDEDGAPVVGRDRLAALAVLGEKTTEVRVASGTPQELKLLEIAENLHRRRDDVDELRAQYVALMERMLGDIESTNVDTIAQRGRPKTTRTRAIEAVAEASGVSPAAVQKSVERAREKAEPKEEPGVEWERPPVTTWGVPTEHLDAELGDIRVAQEALKETDRHLRNAQRSLAALEGGGIGGSLYQRLRAIVHEAADTVRRATPEHLCPWCKGLLHIREKCGGCMGLGYVNGEALEGIATELRKTGPDAVVVNGKGGFIPIAAARVVKREPAKPPAKQVTVVGPAGTVWNPATEAFEEELF